MIAAGATAAAIAANQRVTESCKGVVAYYDAGAASVAQMHAYAACVQRLYPTGVWVDTMWLKLAVAGLLLSFAAGLVKPIDMGWGSRAACAVLYPIGFGCAIGVILLVGAGVNFLIT
jgi:hypothetical protein